MKIRNNKLKSVFFALVSGFLLVTLVSCGAAPAASDSNLQISNAPATSSFNLDLLKRTLGSGYDSAHTLKRSSCIESSQYVYSGSNFADLSYLRDYSYDELMDEMGMGVFAKLDLFGLVTAKVSGDITSTLSKTDDSSAFIVKSDIVGKSAVLKEPTLTPFGLSVYEKNDPVYFREVCGDQFVEQVQLGAQLFIGVKYVFTSKEDKDSLQIQLKGSALWGLIKFTKTWTKEQRKLLKNVRVNISTYQIGGNSQKLEDLRKKIQTESCSADNIEKCAESLDLLMDYATKDFPGQLNGMNVGEDPKIGPAIIGVVTVPYNNQPIYSKEKGEYLMIDIGPDTTVDNAFEPAVDRLVRLQSDLNLDILRRKTLSEFNLTPQEKAQIEVGQRDIEGLLLASSQLMDNTCKPARAKSALRAECIAKIGQLEVKGKNALKPIVLSSRK